MIKVLEWGARSIQIFGDSKLTINWAMGSHRCNILHLTPLLNEILLIKSHFDFICFTHVYKEINSTMDKLSKEVSQLQEGEDISDDFLRDPGGYYHRPCRDLIQRVP